MEKSAKYPSLLFHRTFHARLFWILRSNNKTGEEALTHKYTPLLLTVCHLCNRSRAQGLIEAIRVGASSDDEDEDDDGAEGALLWNKGAASELRLKGVHTHLF